jgi:hypothetical protein
VEPPSLSGHGPGGTTGEGLRESDNFYRLTGVIRLQQWKGNFYHALNVVKAGASGWVRWFIEIPFIMPKMIRNPVSTI